MTDCKSVAKESRNTVVCEETSRGYSVYYMWLHHTAGLFTVYDSKLSLLVTEQVFFSVQMELRTKKELTL